MSDRTQDPAAIERDIGRTRARLDQTLEELQQRLSPGQVIDEALDYFRKGQANDFMRNLTASVREKPLPVLLAGVGIAWMMASGAGPSTPRQGRVWTGPYSGADDYDALLRRAHGAGEAVSRGTDETEEAWRLRVSEAKGGVLGLTRSAQETAASFTDRVEQALSGLQDQISAGIDRMRMTAHDTMDALGDRVTQAREMASDRIAQGRDALDSMRSQGRDAVGTMRGYGQDAGQSARHMSEHLFASFGDHPMVLGALGVAAGAILGTLLPRTELEEQYLGSTRREIRDTAQQAVQGTMESGSRVAQAAMDAGRDAVREASKGEGLGSQSLRDLGGKVQQVGERVLHASQQAAQKEGLISGEEGERNRSNENAGARRDETGSNKPAGSHFPGG